jgi:hypothetical protein
MTDQKVTDLTAATLPLSGDEEVYVVQGAADRRVAVRSLGGELPGSIAGSYQDMISSSASSLAVNLATLAVGSNRMDLGPFTPARTFRTQSVGTVVTATGAPQIKIVCYAADAAGLPDELLWVTDAIDADTAGYVSDALDFTFVRGRLYWIGVWTSSIGATLRAAPTTNLPAISLSGNAPDASVYATMFRRVVTFADPPPDPWVPDLGELVTGSRHIIRWQTQALP